MAKLTLTRALCTDLGRLWAGVLERIEIRHPDPEASVRFELTDGPVPSLYILATVRDADDPSRFRVDMAVHTMSLRYWPGPELAAAAIARAWMGFMTHEALELVTVDGRKVLDPHAEPYPINPANRLFREGCPVDLTPESLARALATVTTDAVAAPGSPSP